MSNLKCNLKNDCRIQNKSKRLIMQTEMNSEIRNKVAKILSINEDPTWTTETNGNLCLVSSKKDTLPRYPDLRGVVVDLEKEKVIVPCYGRITSVLTAMIHFENKKMEIGDEDGNSLQLDQSNMSFTYGFEGPVVRVYKNHGKIYCSTNRRLDCTKSRWGTKKTFFEMFMELGGETVLEKAFDAEKKYSSHFLTFIVVHPDMLLCTKQKIGRGYLVFLGAKRCFSPSECPYPSEDVDWKQSESKFDVPFVTTDMFETAISCKLPYCPSSLSLENINEHLLLGYGSKYSNDIRTGSGEFVIGTYTSEDGKQRLFRFVSPSYDHRSRMRNEDPNLLHQFYCLSTEAFLNDSDYESKYPWLEYEEVKKQEAEDEQIMFWNRGKRPVGPFDWQKKFRNIWKHFVLSVPLHRQKEVFGYYKQFFLNRDTLVEWLSSWYGKETKDVEEILSVRARKLMQLALDYDRKHNPKACLSLSKKSLEKNLKFLICNERGSSLYMLWKNRKQYLRTLETASVTAPQKEDVCCEDGVCMI